MESTQPLTVNSLLITGGAGFIGSHAVRHFVEKYPRMHIVCLDALTYAGNVANIRDLFEAPNFSFVVADVVDYPAMQKVMELFSPEAVIHLAAESHVDRSIKDPFGFARTNVFGTLSILEAFRQSLARRKCKGRFYQISTDEVYGTLGRDDEPFTESSPYAPRSPYSAAKASADHFVRSYHETYGMDIVLSNCSNNFGPCQFPEKLIPLFIRNILENKPLPVYGNGENIRDWLYVGNHVDAIERVLFHGRSGETYNIGGNNEWRNIDMIKLLIRLTDRLIGRPEGSSLSLIHHVNDRLGHDLRYGINATKIISELEWMPCLSFEGSLQATVEWYLSHNQWLGDITSGKYLQENELARKRYSI